MSNNKSQYNRPKKTYQEGLTNQEIKEKLKDYKQVSDIKTVSIGTHIRYFHVDPATNKRIFRLGGTLTKIDPEGRFIMLSNGTITWSVQILNTVFWKKMTEDEIKEEIKEEIKKELMTEGNIDHSLKEENHELKKEIKKLKKKLEEFEELEKNYKNMVKKNESLSIQISKIEKEIKKEKGKK